MAAFILNVVVLLHALVSICDASPKVFSMRMYRKERSILKKRSTLSVDIGNAITDGLYFVNASVGTPPQHVLLQVDTGSSDIWMFGPHSCDSSTSPCFGGDCESKYVSYIPFNIYRYINPRLPTFLYIGRG
jgi:hypothetical protein